MSKTTHLSLPVLQASFPHNRFPTMWANQEEALRFVAKSGPSLIESPTGSGKTAVEVTILEALARTRPDTNNFFVAPTKTLVEQISREYPHLTVAMGRNEHPCLYYVEDKRSLSPEKVAELRQDGETPRADDIPCSFLQSCPHRVNQNTGETHEPGAYPCPYLRQKWEAKQSTQVLCTMSFYLFTHLFAKEWEDKGGVVVDEIHQFPRVVRNALSYEITDYHLKRSIELLKKIGAREEAGVLTLFFRRMRTIVKRRPPAKPVLLKNDEIQSLIDILAMIKGEDIRKEVSLAIKEGLIDPKADRDVLKKVETLAFSINRYFHSLKYALPDEHRGALNYTYAYYQEAKEDRDKAQYRLVICCYYVAPILRKILPADSYGFSATIGDPEIFSYESCIKLPTLSLKSTFSANKTRIFVPSDALNLAMNSRSRGSVTKTLRRIARAAVTFAKKDHRSLVVVVSNDERTKFLELAAEEGLKVISYGNGVSPKEAAGLFRDGEADCLVGTVANYGEGLDLPRKTAPVIFFLRPAYPSPEDPATQFEERRFGNQRWALWNWRVMVEALQVRGRNIRNHGDTGVTFFCDQRFGGTRKGSGWLFHGLPESLKVSYRNNLTWDECVKETMGLLS